MDKHFISNTTASSPITLQSRILAVDDDPQHLAAVERILRRSRFEVLTATNGKTGLRIVLQQRPDLILLDATMPGMSGHEFLRRLRRLERRRNKTEGGHRGPPIGPETPVIMVSGRSEAHQRVSGLDAGAVDYITKPFEPDELRARIRSQLRRVRHQRTSCWTSSQLIGPSEEDCSRQRKGRETMVANDKAVRLPTVLCVDDEPHVLKALERLLRGSKCRVLLAANGREALELLETIDAGVLALDEDGLIVGDNREARELICPSNCELIGIGARTALSSDMFESLFPEGTQCSGNASGRVLIDEHAVQWRARPIRDDERLRGQILTLWREVA